MQKEIKQLQILPWNLKRESHLFSYLNVHSSLFFFSKYNLKWQSSSGKSMTHTNAKEKGLKKQIFSIEDKNFQGLGTGIAFAI